MTAFLTPLAALLLAVLTVSILAGFFGALAGLGGGMLLNPIFVLYFGLTFGDAVGASAIGVLATSLTTSAAFTREGLVDRRMANLLLAATVPAAIIGATLTVRFANTAVVPVFLIVFGIVLIANVPGFFALRKNAEETPSGEPDRLSRRLHLEGDYFDRPHHQVVHYRAKKTPQTLAAMSGAGLISGLFGIGSGVLVVLTLHRLSGLPFKISTATSNNIVGVEILAPLAILYAGGLVQPELAGPVAIGAATGAYLGGRVLPRMDNRWIRWIFIVILVVFSVQEILKGATGL